MGGGTGKEEHFGQNCILKGTEIKGERQCGHWREWYFVSLSLTGNTLESYANNRSKSVSQPGELRPGDTVRSARVWRASWSLSGVSQVSNILYYILWLVRDLRYFRRKTFTFQTSVEPLKWNRNITYKNERIIIPVPSVHISRNQIFKTNTETEKCSE